MVSDFTELAVSLTGKAYTEQVVTGKIAVLRRKGQRVRGAVMRGPIHIHPN